jgi:coenzyme PQQ precursor peptide PqqA
MSVGAGFEIHDFHEHRRANSTRPASGGPDNENAPKRRVPAIGRPECGIQLEEIAMQWSKPSFEVIRWGFEITMYIATR